MIIDDSYVFRHRMLGGEATVVSPTLMELDTKDNIIKSKQKVVFYYQDQLTALDLVEFIKCFEPVYENGEQVKRENAKSDVDVEEICKAQLVEFKAELIQKIINVIITGDIEGPAIVKQYSADNIPDEFRKYMSEPKEN